MPLSDVNDSVQTGGPIHKLVAKDDGIAGTILDGDLRNATDTDGRVKTFPDGNPMKTYVLKLGQLKKAVSDGATVEHEDGECRIFLGGYQSKTMREAITATAERKIVAGDTVVVNVVALKKNPKGGVPIKEVEIKISAGTPETVAFATEWAAKSAKALVDHSEDPF